MVKQSTIKETWCKDMAALTGNNVSNLSDLFILIKNLMCHYVYEQLRENPNLKEFIIPVVPLGMVKLKYNENNDNYGSWSIECGPIDANTSATLNEMMRCKEDNLYRQQSQILGKSLNKILESIKSLEY